MRVFRSRLASNNPPRISSALRPSRPVERLKIRSCMLSYDARPDAPVAAASGHSDEAHLSERSSPAANRSGRGEAPAQRGSTGELRPSWWLSRSWVLGEPRGQMRPSRRGTDGSHRTPRWRKTDSNPRSPVKKSPFVETVLSDFSATSLPRGTEGSKPSPSTGESCRRVAGCQPAESGELPLPTSNARPRGQAKCSGGQTGRSRKVLSLLQATEGSYLSLPGIRSLDGLSKTMEPLRS
jgi:hypothetical protein